MSSFSTNYFNPSNYLETENIEKSYYFTKEIFFLIFKNLTNYSDIKIEKIINILLENTIQLIIKYFIAFIASYFYNVTKEEINDFQKKIKKKILDLIFEFSENILKQNMDFMEYSCNFGTISFYYLFSNNLVPEKLYLFEFMRFCVETIFKILVGNTISHFMLDYKIKSFFRLQKNIISKNKKKETAILSEVNSFINPTCILNKQINIFEQQKLNNFLKEIEKTKESIKRDLFLISTLNNEKQIQEFRNQFSNILNETQKKKNIKNELNLNSVSESIKKKIFVPNQIYKLKDLKSKIEFLKPIKTDFIENLNQLNVKNKYFYKNKRISVKSTQPFIYKHSIFNLVDKKISLLTKINLQEEQPEVNIISKEETINLKFQRQIHKLQMLEKKTKENFLLNKKINNIYWELK